MKRYTMYTVLMFLLFCTQDNNTTTAPAPAVVESDGLAVKCTSEYMEASLDLKKHSGVSPDQAHLEDAKCRITRTDGDFLFFKTKLDGCGTKHNTTDDAIIYYNSIFAESKAGSNNAKISRALQAEFPFKCSYLRSAILSVVSFSPKRKVVYTRASDYGNFALLMDLYKSDKFEEAFDEYPINVALNAWLNVETSVKSNDSKLALFNAKCWATPTSDRDDSNAFVFINNGCKKERDENMEHKFKKNEPQQQFKIRAFRFVSGTATNDVYLHCRVEVCREGDKDSNCAKGCAGVDRQRRSLASDASSEVLTIGVIKVGKGDNTQSADCADPGVPNDGQRLGDVFTHGSFVNFTCSSVTILIGSPRINCRDGSWSNKKPVCEGCDSPLGLESKKIPDANIKASSHKDWDHRPRYGRLNHPRAWCSASAWSVNLEIDLGKPYRITYLATQGSERDKKWVKQYIVGHTLARSSYVEYRENHREKVFTGNKDATSIVRHKLKIPFIARKIRFYPHDLVGYLISRACMRVEIYGCDIPNDCVMVGSRVLGKWGRTYRGGDTYYKAYVKTISRNDVQLDLENEDQDDRYFKFLPKTSIVLDVPPKQEELRIRTRVLAPWDKTYYPGRIMSKTAGKYYLVKTDDGDRIWLFTIDKLRRLKSERFCE